MPVSTWNRVPFQVVGQLFLGVETPESPAPGCVKYVRHSGQRGTLCLHQPETGALSRGIPSYDSPPPRSGAGELGVVERGPGQMDELGDGDQDTTNHDPDQENLANKAHPAVGWDVGCANWCRGGEDIVAEAVAS